MKKAIIWGTGRTFNQYINLLKYHEILKNIIVIGVISKSTMFENIYGYKCLSKNKIRSILFDIVIYMGAEEKFQEAKTEMIALGIEQNKIIMYKALTIPDLNMTKYMELISNTPTIFSNDCWGGLVYNRLGLEFSSPFINMYENGEDYIKFLEKPEKYLAAPLQLEKQEYSEFIKGYYPICKCDDILLYFNHYHSFESANQCWERRKKRINRNNIFVKIHTEDKKIAAQFADLPYEKKICFVPFETNEKSLFYVNFQKRNEKQPFWKVVQGMVASDYCCYDLLELIYSGNVVQKSEFI